MNTLLVLLLSLSSQSFAVTKLNFTLGGMQVIGMLKPTDWDGSSDDDGARLYQLMNVEETDSMLGPGKAVKDKAQFLTITCAKNSTECSIVLRRGSYAKIEPRRKTAEFVVRGAAARLWSDQFHLPENGDPLEFESTDGKFRLYVGVEVFSLKFSENL